MTTYTVTTGTKLHCNRNECGATFEAPRDLERLSFSGSNGTRVIEMIPCPVCHTVDSHWVFASDVVPQFTGGFDARKRAERQWLMNN